MHLQDMPLILRERYEFKMMFATSCVSELYTDIRDNIELTASFPNTVFAHKAKMIR